MKRVFDLVVSSFAVLVLAPLLAALSALIKFSSSGPVLFRHERVGRNYSTFDVLKFRTMQAGSSGASITSAGDQRITNVGAVLRQYKLDELPQLFNVIRGDMSIVGPRPEVMKYVTMDDRYETILQVRPGLTDPASLAFRHEQDLLGSQQDPERFYVEEILGQKISLSVDYVENQSLLTDLKLILRTILAILR